MKRRIPRRARKKSTSVHVKAVPLPGSSVVLSNKAVTKRDRLAAITLFLGTVGTFAWGATSLGFYYDDSGFLSTLPFIGNPIQLWTKMRDYVPGRNLHILWQYLIFVLVRNPGAHLPALHYVQSVLDGVAVVAFYFLLRRLETFGRSLCNGGGFIRILAHPWRDPLLDLGIADEHRVDPFPRWIRAHEYFLD